MPKPRRVRVFSASRSILFNMAFGRSMDIRLVAPMPDDARLIEVHNNPTCNGFDFIVESSTFDEVPDGEMCPRQTLEYAKVTQDAPGVFDSLLHLAQICADADRLAGAIRQRMLSRP